MLFRSNFGKIDEESVKNIFVVIYELTQSCLCHLASASPRDHPVAVSLPRNPDGKDKNGEGDSYSREKPPL